MSRVFAALLVALVLSGCATTDDKRVLRVNPRPTEASYRMFFPPPRDGEVPRYLYLGELQGEQNFVYPEERKEHPFVTALKWLAGVFDSNEIVTLQRPQAGVVDEGGRVLVTDVGRSAVYVFDQNEGRLDVWERAEGMQPFISPVGIALGPAGQVFVADADLKRVILIDREGKGLGIIGQDQLKRPTGIAWDANAALLYVADTLDHQIKVFDMTGRLVRTIGQRGEGPGEFNYPTYIALDHHGRLVVADTMNARVQVINLAGEAPPLVIGKRGLRIGDMVRPKGVAVDSEGNIYVVESYYDHMLVFDRAGHFLLPLGGTGQAIGQFFLPGGLWIDARNRVYVADTFNGRVEIFQFLGGGAESE